MKASPFMSVFIEKPTRRPSNKSSTMSLSKEKNLKTALSSLKCLKAFLHTNSPVHCRHQSIITLGGKDPVREKTLFCMKDCLSQPRNSIQNRS